MLDSQELLNSSQELIFPHPVKFTCNVWKTKCNNMSNKLILEERNWTLLHWILLVSNVVWGRLGNRCFKQSKRLSALSASISLLSPSTIRSFTIPHDDFAVDRLEWRGGFKWALRRQMYIVASTRFAMSRTMCSEDRSRQSSRQSAENWSDVIYL